MAIRDIYNAVLEYDEDAVINKTQAELDLGTDIQSILNEGLISPMDEVGERFSAGELFVPEMLMAAQVMKSGLEILKPRLTGKTSQNKGTVIIGTIKGDLHDIGKNLVALMVEGAGFEVIDLGVDVKAEDFAKAAKENNADLIALSALLTTTMPEMENTINVIKEKSSSAKTIVGGAPVTLTFADQIGADGYASDAAGAMRLVKELIA